jgi:glycosyltransferase involved in cell wall biosynthesis
MKILMLSEFYGKTGGINTHMIELSRFLKHEVILSNRLESLKCNPDILHIHHAFTPLTLRAVKQAKKRGIPTVLTNHSIAPLYNSRMWKLLNIWSRYLNDVDVIIAVSNAAKKFISRFVSAEVVVIPNGVDVDRFKPVGKKENHTLLYVGRLSIRKGIHVLIPLLSRCLSELNAQLIVTGQNEMFMLSLLKLERAICRNVRILGFVPSSKLPKLYSNATITLIPSLTMESFGITAIESLACETPVVATRSGSLPEIVSGGGIAVKLHEFPEVVADLLSDPVKIRKLGKKGRENVRKKYSWDLVARRVEELYLDVLDSN